MNARDKGSDPLSASQLSRRKGRFLLGSICDFVEECSTHFRVSKLLRQIPHDFPCGMHYSCLGHLTCATEKLVFTGKCWRSRGGIIDPLSAWNLFCRISHVLPIGIAWLMFRCSKLLRRRSHLHWEVLANSRRNIRPTFGYTIV